MVFYHLIEDRDKLDNWLYFAWAQSVSNALSWTKFLNAVVHEAVEIRKRGSRVCALLRKIEREGVADVKTIKRKNKRYSIQYSLPVWLVQEALIEEYGEEEL